LDILLGLDLGTTNSKAVAYDTRGQPLATASRSTPTRDLGARRAELDAPTLWQEAAAVLRKVTTRLPAGARVAGVCVASMGEAGVPLDAAGEPLYPIIAWYDERTLPQAAWWAQALGEARIYRLTGVPLGHIFTLNKLLWLREHEPQVFARLAKWLCVSDYLAYRLTGEMAMGTSLASRTMALDLERRVWSEEMLRCAGLAATLFPPLQAEGALVGRVTATAAGATGLAEGTPVYVGGHDHVCGALAMGVYRPGTVLDSTGTTEAQLTPVDGVADYLAKGDLSFCLGCHVARGRYYVLGSILGAGSMVMWLARQLWPQEYARDAAEALSALTQAATQTPLGARGLYMLPHLAGAGSPQRDASARGVMVGWSVAHTRADLARAAFEGLAYELRLLWEALAAFTGHPLARIIAAGGGARNTAWMQIKADVTGQTLLVPAHTEAVTLGAAILAGLGAGIYADEDDAQRQLRVPLHAIAPREESRREYDRLYRVLMECIRPMAAELGRRSGHMAPLDE
jgi:xylulokinase